MLVWGAAGRAYKSVKTISRHFILSSAHLVGMRLGKMPVYFPSFAFKITVRTLHGQIVNRELRIRN